MGKKVYKTKGLKSPSLWVSDADSHIAPFAASYVISFRSMCIFTVADYTKII